MVTTEDNHILVIDDNESLCRSIELILSKHGHQISTANCGESALEIIDQDDISIALVDLKLPDISGSELLLQIKEKNINTDIIIMTGYASVDSAVSGYEVGAYAYLTKPLSMDVLISTIDILLEKRRFAKEKILAENALRQSEDLLSAFMETAPCGFALLDQNMIGVKINEAGKRLFCLSGENEIFGNQTCAMAPFLRDSVGDAVLQHVLETSEPLLIEDIVFPMSDNHYSIKAFKVGTFLGIIANDITNQINAKLEIQKYTRELELYASLIRHDLKNDLGLIQMNMDLASMVHSDPNSELTLILDTINSVCQRMLNLLTVMGKTSTDTKTNLIDLINTAASIAQKAHPELSIKITKISEDEIALTSTSRLLSLVFENLFRNAAQYAGLHPEIEVVIETKKETIEIRVIDNGPGISSEIRDQLFQKGVSSRKGGGYGLYLSKEILSLIGGSIELETSDKGSGAVFVINIPSC